MFFLNADLVQFLTSCLRRGRPTVESDDVCGISHIVDSLPLYCNTQGLNIETLRTRLKPSFVSVSDTCRPIIQDPRLTSLVEQLASYNIDSTDPSMPELYASNTHDSNTCGLCNTYDLCVAEIAAGDVHNQRLSELPIEPIPLFGELRIDLLYNELKPTAHIYRY